jgi:pSer/pThr/pTyr-binding forkhead associated (FHA) protein
MEAGIVAVLVGISGEVKGKTFEIAKDRVVLGRHANCDIIVNDTAVSSQHCYIARRDNRFILHDLNSTNGTQLNGGRITEAELTPKQIVQIGSTELMFDASPAESESPPREPMTNTQIVIDDEPPVAAPKSFSSVSPFGARRRDNRGLWLTVLVVVGLLALAGLVHFLLVMFK